MTKNEVIKIFNQQKVRTHWDDDAEKWYFSVVDVVAILTESDRPRKYWNDLKAKLTEEGGQLSAKIGQLKMRAEDGKIFSTDTRTPNRLLKTQEKWGII